MRRRRPSRARPPRRSLPSCGRAASAGWRRARGASRATRGRAAAQSSRLRRLPRRPRCRSAATRTCLRRRSLHRRQSTQARRRREARRHWPRRCSRKTSCARSGRGTRRGVSDTFAVAIVRSGARSAAPRTRPVRDPVCPSVIDSMTDRRPAAVPCRGSMPSPARALNEPDSCRDPRAAVAAVIGGPVAVPVSGAAVAVAVSVELRGVPARAAAGRPPAPGRAASRALCAQRPPAYCRTSRLFQLHSSDCSAIYDYHIRAMNCGSLVTR